MAGVLQQIDKISFASVPFIQAYYQGVPSRLPDLKIAGPFPGYLHKVQCTSAHVQCTKLHTSALDWAQANQAAYLVPTYVYKSCPMVEKLTILLAHFEE